MSSAHDVQEWGLAVVSLSFSILLSSIVIWIITLMVSNVIQNWKDREFNREARTMR